jgi:hypothetical protein
VTREITYMNLTRLRNTMGLYLRQKWVKPMVITNNLNRKAMKFSNRKMSHCSNSILLPENTQLL